jgi:hypothetical protein
MEVCSWDDFLDAVEKMRAAQKEYYNLSSWSVSKGTALANAKNREAAVDTAIKEIRKRKEREESPELYWWEKD